MEGEKDKRKQEGREDKVGGKRRKGLGEKCRGTIKERGMGAMGGSKREEERCFPSLCPSSRSPCVPTAVSTRPMLSSPCLPLERANGLLCIPEPDCLLLLWTVPQHPCSVTFGSQHRLCAYSPLSENGGTDKTHKEPRVAQW